LARMPLMEFESDSEQSKVSQHAGGPLLVTGGAGTGKTVTLRERFARLIEAGQDPERVALVVRSKQARAAARVALLQRLSRPLPGIRVLTVHGLANHAMTNRFAALGYDGPPDVPNAVAFAGLINQAAEAARTGDRLFDHVIVDDFQEATLAEEALLIALAPGSLVVAGDAGSHVFSFQGATDLPLRRFRERHPSAIHVELAAPHRCSDPAYQACTTSHTSEDHAAVARELRRIHVQEDVPWGELAVVVRREGSQTGGLLRALDDARVPRSTSEGT